MIRVLWDHSFTGCLLPIILRLEMINDIHLIGPSFIITLAISPSLVLSVVWTLAVVRLVLFWLLDISRIVLSWSLTTAASWRSSDGAIVILLRAIGLIFLLLVFLTIDISAVLLDQVLRHILHSLLILGDLFLDIFRNNFSPLRIHIWILGHNLIDLYFIVVGFVDFLNLERGSLVGAQIITRFTIKLLTKNLDLWRNRVIADVTLILCHSHLPLIHSLLLVLSPLLFPYEILKVALILRINPSCASTLRLFADLRIIAH